MSCIAGGLFTGSYLIAISEKDNAHEKYTLKHFSEDSVEKEMATYSSILAWEIPWTEEPGRLQPMGSQSGTRLSD